MLTALQLGFITMSQFFIKFITKLLRQTCQKCHFQWQSQKYLSESLFQSQLLLYCHFIVRQEKSQRSMANELSEVSFMFTAQW